MKSKKKFSMGDDGIRQIWHNARLRERGYGRAGEILKYAKTFRHRESDKTEIFTYTTCRGHP